MQVYVSDHRTSVGVIAGVIAIIPVVMLLRCIIIYLYGYLMSWVVVRAIADLRTRAFEHLLNLPLSFFSASSTGELMSRVQDFGVLQTVMTNSVMTMVREPAQVVVHRPFDWRAMETDTVRGLGVPRFHCRPFLFIAKKAANRPERPKPTPPGCRG